MSTEERAFWKNFVFIRIPLICGVGAIGGICIGAMQVPIHSMPPDQRSWIDQQSLDKDLTPLVLKEDWYNYYKERALFGFRTGCSVVITFALLNAAIFRSNRQNQSDDRT